MLRYSLGFAFIYAALLPPAFAEEASCDLVTKYKDGSSSGSSAKVTLDSGKVTAVYVESFNASGEEGGAYFCTYDSAGEKPKFVVRGALTVVSTANEVSQSQVKVRKVGESFVIDPSNISRDYCGAGAEWPRAIAIEPGKKKCKVSR